MVVDPGAEEGELGARVDVPRRELLEVSGELGLTERRRHVELPRVANSFQALCERDGGRLWGVSICAPMVIGDARTQTFATSQPPPDAPRPKLIGLVNGPIQWGNTMWAALTWDTIANWPARTRGEAFLHESFHIVQPALILNGPAGANEHLDSVDGRYWLRLEWRALARALRE